MTDWYKIKRVLIRPNGTEKQVYPAVYKREPDASRTLLYLPLESDATDMSWNSRTTSASGVTYTTVGWVQSAHVGTTGWIVVTPKWFITNTDPKTISFLYYVTQQISSSRRYLLEWAVQSKTYQNIIILENTSYWNCSATNTLTSTSWSVVANSWQHVVITQNNNPNDATGYKIYINGVLNNTASWNATPRWSWSSSSQNLQAVLCWRGWVNYWENFNWNAREIIFENVEWSADDASNYYNRIKAKLWF